MARRERQKLPKGHARLNLTLFLIGLNCHRWAVFNKELRCDWISSMSLCPQSPDWSLEWGLTRNRSYYEPKWSKDSK